MSEEDTGTDLGVGPRVLKGLVHGEGSFLHFLSTSHNSSLSPSQPPSTNIYDRLILPFRDHISKDDGKLRMCCLADKDKWNTAIELLKKQSMVVGGPSLKFHGSFGVRKYVECSREGRPKASSSSASSNPNRRHNRVVSDRVRTGGEVVQKYF